MAIQTQYDINPQAGYVGQLARPAEPYALDLLPAHAAGNLRKPRPGDMVYWDRTNNGAAVVTSAAEFRDAIGIVTYNPGTVAKTLAAAPAGANSDTYVEYEDHANMPVLVFGSVHLLAGGAMEYGDAVGYDFGDHDWTTAAAPKPAAIGNIIRRIVECVDLDVSDGDIFTARIGYGRVF